MLSEGSKKEDSVMEVPRGSLLIPEAKMPSESGWCLSRFISPRNLGLVKCTRLTELKTHAPPAALESGQQRQQSSPMGLMLWCAVGTCP